MSDKQQKLRTTLFYFVASGKLENTMFLMSAKSAIECFSILLNEKLFSKNDIVLILSLCTETECNELYRKCGEYAIMHALKSSRTQGKFLLIYHILFHLCIIYHRYTYNIAFHCRVITLYYIILHPPYLVTDLVPEGALCSKKNIFYVFSLIRKSDGSLVKQLHYIYYMALHPFITLKYSSA